MKTTPTPTISTGEEGKFGVITIKQGVDGSFSLRVPKDGTVKDLHELAEKELSKRVMRRLAQSKVSFIEGTEMEFKGKVLQNDTTLLSLNIFTEEAPEETANGTKPHKKKTNLFVQLKFTVKARRDVLVVDQLDVKSLEPGSVTRMMVWSRALVLYACL
ncbi:hypothetical protein SARC_03808 [Sphaeroforma arctica JP610]|uniref:Ubiquitin-like domain-containing protein n=1 Tax=Sphaeroforma arctica JP610 TaxID=667725 RepID=A0A0L0G4U6_9EUKA|nr:hypothetical protein SARC_03808 [Sphaeroforma arctica JP610]KNC83944.1 hypothetical protein SARC_03808 [Sphaeroforma arctica JP610]|eukprot:XP_014157846.1 hypothetical protein SARC_03808 [Sphaeroforma arctica JP610]